MDDDAPIWGVWRVSNASSPLQECGDPVRVVRHHRGLIAKAGMNRGSIGSLQFSGVITEDVIGILQQVAGETRHHVGAGRHGAGRRQLANAGAMAPDAVSLRMPASVAAEA